MCARSQVGVVGRTGAGKSSVINALFRLQELAGGRIVVDGVDTSRLDLRALRRSMALIPQARSPPETTGPLTLNGMACPGVLCAFLFPCPQCSRLACSSVPALSLPSTQQTQTYRSLPLPGCERCLQAASPLLLCIERCSGVEGRHELWSLHRPVPLKGG